MQSFIDASMFMCGEDEEEEEDNEEEGGEGLGVQQVSEIAIPDLDNIT